METFKKAVSEGLPPPIAKRGCSRFEMQPEFEGLSNSSIYHNARLSSDLSHDLDLKDKARSSPLNLSKMMAEKKTSEEAVSEDSPPADVKRVHLHLDLQDEFERSSISDEDIMSSDFAHELKLELENFNAQPETSQASNLATSETFEEADSQLFKLADIRKVYSQMVLLQEFEGCSKCNSSKDYRDSMVSSDSAQYLELELENVEARSKTLQENFEEEVSEPVLPAGVKQIYLHLGIQQEFEGCSNVSKHYDSTVTHDFPPGLKLELKNFNARLETVHESKFNTKLLLGDIEQMYHYLERKHSFYRPKNELCAGAYKKDENALLFLNAGHEIMNHKRYESAIGLYTVSIAYAPYDSELLVSGYTGQTKALSGCNLLQCLGKEDLANKWKEMLHELITDCSIELNQNEESVSINPNAKDFIERCGIPHLSPAPNKWKYSCKFDNRFLQNTTSKIKLDCDEKRGRYVVATRDIEPGEILSSEKFFLLRLAPDRIYLNCAYCLSLCVTLIPCPECSMVMYCSSACRSKASNLYHRTECKLWSCYEDIENIDENLALSVQAFLIGTQQGKRMSYLMERLKVEDIFEQTKDDPRNRKFSNDYFQILKILREFEPSRIRKFELMESIVNIIIKLQQLSFFKSTSSLQKSVLPDLYQESFAALLILNHYVSFENHTFSVLGMSGSHSKDLQREVQFASGICSLHNLINRSCNPNVFGFVQERQHVLFATKKIKSGEELFLSNCLEAFVGEDSEIVFDSEFLCLGKLGQKMWPIFPELKKQKIKKKKKLLIAKLAKIASPLMTEDSKILTRTELLPIIINLTKFLCESVQVPSADIYRCGVLLAKYMNFLYGDHHHCFEAEFFLQTSQLELLQLVTHNIQRMVEDENK